MRYVQSVLLLAAAAACSACFQFSTVLSVKADGSGTIEQRLLFSQSAVAQLRQFAALSGGAPDFDPLSERQARDAAATLGSGVTYVSSTPIDSSDGVGRDIRYAFSDVNQLSLDQAPPSPGGMAAPPQGAGSGERVTFKLTRQADGRSLLTIMLPEVPPISASSGPSAEQVAMLKPMLTGARLSIDIEPAGTLVRTSSPFVSGRRVTLLDVNADALFKDDTLLPRLQSAATPEEMKTILKSVPDIKLNLDPEITIEFSQ